MNTAVLTDKALLKNKWEISSVDGLEIIRSPLLAGASGLTHAFTTRHGGTSEPPLDSFNLGRHWDSQESRIDAVKNRERLCAALGLRFDRLTVPGQQHTTNIYVVDAETACHDQRLPDLDAAATDQPGFPLLLHFADCVPVMVFDTKRKALAVIHAGWKGTAGGIAGKAVQLLVDRFAAQPDNMVAAVGPAIGSCCYPTGEDVADKLSASVKRCDRLIERGSGQPRPDLKAINAMQLLEAGVGQVDVSEWCTACHPEIFYSHRQSGGKTGRQGAIACIQ